MKLFRRKSANLFRHGDVFIAECKQVPVVARLLPHCTLAKGELTGHAHKIQERDAAELLEFGDTLYLRVKAERATVVHEEHAPIALARGLYRVWIQREYSPQEIRRVLD